MKIPPEIRVFGDMKFRGKDCPREAAEQVTFFNQIRKHYPESFGLIAVHNRNEGLKSVQQVNKEKMEGMASGSPDVVIPGSPTFLCELKRLDHTICKWQPGQLPYLLAAQEQGAFCCVALGWQAAWEAFEHWRTHVLRSA